MVISGLSSQELTSGLLTTDNSYLGGWGRTKLSAGGMPGLQSEFVASLDKLMRYRLKMKRKKVAGNRLRERDHA